MTGQIMLDTDTSQTVQATADAFMESIRGLVAPHGPKLPNEAASFFASVGVQAVIRGLFEPTQPEVNQAILMGGAEGVGMLLGLIEDPYTRMALFQHCVQAMHTGLQTQSRIHNPVGEA